MIPHLSGQEQAAMIVDAAAAARSVEPGTVHVSATFNSETGIVRFSPIPRICGKPPLALLGVALAAGADLREELLGEAVESLYELPAEFQAEVLLRLAPHLPGAAARQITAAYRFLLHDPVREELLRSLTGQMEPKLDQETEDTEGPAESFHFQVQAKLYGFDPFRLNRNLELTDRVVTTLRFARAEEGRSLTAEQERSMKVSILSDYIRQLPEEERQAISEDARRLRSESGWHRAMAVVLDRLASVESPEAAIAEARSIWPEGWPPMVSGTLAKHLPATDLGPVLDQAMASIREMMDDRYDRIIAYGALLPNLKEPARGEALYGMAAACELAGRWSFEDLAPYLLMLPPPQLLSIVQRVLRSAGNQQELLNAVREMLPAMEFLSGRRWRVPSPRLCFRCFAGGLDAEHGDWNDLVEFEIVPLRMSKQAAQAIGATAMKLVSRPRGPTRRWSRPLRGGSAASR